MQSLPLYVTPSIRYTSFHSSLIRHSILLLVFAKKTTQTQCSTHNIVRQKRERHLKATGFLDKVKKRLSSKTTIENLENIANRQLEKI